MKKLLIIIAVLVLSIAFTGCSAVSMASDVSSVVTGMRYVMAGGVDSVILQSEQLILMAYPNGSKKMSMVVLSRASGQPVRDLTAIFGNNIHMKNTSWSELRNTLICCKGWKVIAPSAVPAVIAEGIAVSGTSLGMMYGRIMPTILIASASSFNYDPFYAGEQ
jgi:predicted small secreted protein